MQVLFPVFHCPVFTFTCEKPSRKYRHVLNTCSHTNAGAEEQRGLCVGEC